MKLLGKAVLVNIPKRPESVIELTPEVEKQLEADMIKQWTKLEVFAVGDTVEKVKKGDSVYISTGSLMGGERIEVEGEVRMLLNEFDIKIIW